MSSITTLSTRELDIDNDLYFIVHLQKVETEDVVVENVHLSDSLMQLSYNIVKNQQK